MPPTPALPPLRHGCAARDPAPPLLPLPCSSVAPLPVQVTRYQSTTFSLTYDEFRRLKEEGQLGGLGRLRRQQPLVAVGAQS